MKVEVVETTCPAATGNYDITGSTPNNDMVGAIFITGATLNHNNTATGRWSFGATDLTNNVGISIAMQDGNLAAGARGMMSASHCLFTANALGAQTAPVAAYSATLSNGVRLNATAITANRITETLLISGSDVAMKVGTQYIASGSTSAAVTHGLGGTPDVIILLIAHNIASNTDEVDAHGMSIGFWDRTSGNNASVALYMTDAANPSDIGGAAFNNSAGEIFSAPGTNPAHVTLTSVGSTQFTISLSANPGTNNMYGWIALRGTAAQMFAKNLLTTMPTGTGANTPVSGMSGKPQALLTIPTRLVVSNTVKTDDTAGSVGISAAASGAATTYGNQAATFEDNLATSVAKTALNNQFAVSKTDNTGNADVQATVTSWDAGGVTLNYSAVGASAFEVAMLAFGLASSSGSKGGISMMGVGN